MEGNRVKALGERRSEIDERYRRNADVRPKIRPNDCPVSVGRARSIGEAGWCWSGRTTGSSLSFRTNGWCPDLACEKLMRLLFYRKTIVVQVFESGGARCHVIRYSPEHPGSLRLQSLQAASFGERFRPHAQISAQYTISIHIAFNLRSWLPNQRLMKSSQSNQGTTRRHASSL
jgi:hypothetical protein